MPPPAISLLVPQSAADLDAVRALILEYNASLAIDLQLQGLDAELASLPGAYAPPRGRLYLARAGDARVPAGCGALRPLAPGDCELKRMYVRPELRRLGAARAIAERLVADARAIGYRRMLLDTIPEMEPAIALYVSLGFRPIEPYFDNPIPEAIHLGLALDATAG